MDDIREIIPPDLHDRAARRYAVDHAAHDAVRRRRMQRGAEAGLAVLAAVFVAGWYWTSLPHPPSGDPAPAPVEVTPVAPERWEAAATTVPPLGAVVLRTRVLRAGVRLQAQIRAARRAARGETGVVVYVNGRRLPVRSRPAATPRARTAPSRVAAAAAGTPAAATPAAPGGSPSSVPVSAPLGAVAYEVLSDADGHLGRILEPREPSTFGPRGVGGWPSNVAVDLAAPAGTPVYAPIDGVVTYAYDRSGIGPTTPGWGVAIDSGRGLAVFLTHMQGVHVQVGQNVRRGQRIGQIGDLFDSIPDHVHIGMGRSWATPGMSSGLDPQDHLPRA